MPDLKFPIYRNYRGLFIFGKIYLRKDIYENIKSNDPDIYYLSILEHEKSHQASATKIVYLRYCMKYLFNRSFRLAEEINAIKTQIIFMRENGQKYEYIDRSAKALSSWTYLWAGNYKEIKEILEKI